MRKIITTSPSQTKNLAEKLAKQILLAKSDLASRERALIIGLFGDLGAGKTTFTQGFAKGLEIKQKIASPTFVILKIYKPSVFTNKTFARNKSFIRQNQQQATNLPNKQINYKLIHIDAYRLDNPEELLILNWRELIKNPQNIILIEWADKIKKSLPKDSVKIVFKHLGKNKRGIFVSGF